MHAAVYSKISKDPVPNFIFDLDVNPHPHTSDKIEPQPERQQDAPLDDKQLE